jgi:hypothetical protein
MLSAEERARLRPEVDAVALTELLRRTPEDGRAVILLACLAEPTPADFRRAGLPAPPAEARGPREVRPYGPLPPGQLRFLVESHSELHLQFDEPELAELWARATGMRRRPPRAGST